MDIEKLSKSQIILLALLASFVTSIATGIVTVSLMQQAPPAIAQTVNRIVERTIERVASTTPKGQAAATVITQEKTVVVKESDLISQAVAKVQPSLVRLYYSSEDAGKGTFLGIGVMLDASGTIASATDALGENADAVAELPDGARVRAFVTSRDNDSGIAYLAAATSSSNEATASWSPVSIAASRPSLGETVVALGGQATPRIAAGIVTAIEPPAKDSTLSVVETDIPRDSILPGSPLIDTEGDLVGMRTGVAGEISGSGFLFGSALMKTERGK